MFGLLDMNHKVRLQKMMAIRTVYCTSLDIYPFFTLLSNVVSWIVLNCYRGTGFCFCAHELKLRANTLIMYVCISITSSFSLTMFSYYIYVSLTSIFSFTILSTLFAPYSVRGTRLIGFSDIEVFVSLWHLVSSVS